MIARRPLVPLLLLTAVALLVMGLPAVTPPASAASTVLCKGFKECKQAGMPHYTYKKNHEKSWWAMYAGHNCTNYVAFRMIRNGMSPTRPWTGSGNASNWGVALKDKVNQKPLVGSVAWWKGQNHVAYVEEIVDADTIIVSEDHYGGDFNWRRITRTAQHWPTGFIHLADEAVEVKTPPALAGTPTVGVALTARPGSWNRSPVTLRYQWLQDGQAIAGATAAAYTPGPDQVGRAIAARITAVSTGYVNGRTTTAAAVVQPGTVTVTSATTISGEAKVGGTLVAEEPVLLPAATTTAIRWTADGTMIPGATAATLRVSADLVGARIAAVVTGSRVGYRTVTSASAATAPVLPEQMSLSAPPTLAGDPLVGTVLRVTGGAAAPAAKTVAYRWFRDGVKITGKPGAQATYRPTAADVKKNLTVKVTYRRPGYRNLVTHLSATDPVRAVPAIRMRAKGKRRTVIRIVPGVGGAVRGTLIVTDAQGHRVKRVVKGRAIVLRKPWLRGAKGSTGQRAGAGKNAKVTIRYSGSPRLTGVTVRRAVTVW